MTFSLAFVLVAVTVSAGQVPTETVTGPISSTAVWDWEPGVRSMPELPMPDLVSSIDTWLGVAYYWVKTTFIDTNSVDYYIIYNFAVGMLGNAIGNILGRGGFLRSLPSRPEEKSTNTDSDTVIVKVDER